MMMMMMMNSTREVTLSKPGKGGYIIVNTIYYYITPFPGAPRLLKIKNGKIKLLSCREKYTKGYNIQYYNIKM